jgi:hypothetical protein
MRRLLFRPLLASLTLFWAAGSAAAQGRPSFAVLPGGVADRDGKTGYVQAPAGGVEALDLASGKVLWQTAETCKPVALAGDRLLCQAPEKGKANAVRILVLDTSAKGKLVRRSDPVEFPAWVSVGTAHGRSFTSHAQLAGKDKLLLHWEARAFYAGGAAPTPEIQERARKHAAGVAAIDLDSGRVTMGEKKAAKEAALELPKDLQGLKPSQVWTGSDWIAHPLRVGKKAVVLLKSQTGARQKLELLAWDPATGKAEPKVELMEGRELWPQLSGDRRYVFVHQALVKEQLPPGEYAWTVFDLETGKRRAKVPFEPGAEGLTVLGPRAYYAVTTRKGGFRPGGGPGGLQQTRVLKAVEVASGRPLWQRPIWAPPFLPPLP